MPAQFARQPEALPAEGGRRFKRRKTRWSSEEDRFHSPSFPVQLPQTLSPKQLDVYIIHARLDEISRKLRSPESLVPRERSPSPEPIYGNDGKRVNTREARYRKKFEDERHKLVDKAFKLDAGFRPPADYRRPTKLQDKVYIPAKEFPEINFIGLLIGPRGNTLKKMESESLAKISIRGKGSVKEGKGSASHHAPGQEEELHCLVTADSEDKIKKAIKLINEIIETSASVPEGQNELKRNQLRELAALNGTLRDDESQICANCGATGHRKWDCPEQRNITLNLICRICGGAGHTAHDCRQRNNPEALNAAREREQKLDSEYAELMKELGEEASNLPAGVPWQQLPTAPVGEGPESAGAGGAPWAQQPGPPSGESGGAPWNGNADGAAPPPPPPLPLTAEGGAPWANRSEGPAPWANQPRPPPMPMDGPAPWSQAQPPPPPPPGSAPWARPPGDQPPPPPWAQGEPPMPPPPPEPLEEDESRKQES